MPFPTENQVGFYLDLVAENAKARNADKAEALAAAHDFLIEADRHEVSHAIDTLIKARATTGRLPAPPPQVQAPADPADAYYLLDGTVYRVQASKTPGRCYAKALVLPAPGATGRARWEYAPGKIHALTPEQNLTIEEACALGHLHGYCMVCGLRLNTPKSVRAGIGPVCAKKLGRKQVAA